METRGLRGNAICLPIFPSGFNPIARRRCKANRKSACRTRSSECATLTLSEAAEPAVAADGRLRRPPLNGKAFGGRNCEVASLSEPENRMGDNAPHSSRSPMPMRRGRAIVTGTLFAVACLNVAVLASAPCESALSTAFLRQLLGVAMLLLGVATVYRAQRRWLAGGAVVVAVVGIAAGLRGDLPFVTRWAASRASFDAHVAHDAVPARARRIGLFYVHEEDISSDGAHWFHFTAEGECTACLICLGCGVVWLPPSFDVRSTDDSLRSIGGRWYLFKQCT